MKIILSGPSGAGKDTLIDMWIEKNPRVKRVITATTREPRPGEINGVSYHFYTMAEMEAKIENGDFLEHMNVFGNIYGTPKDSVDSVVDFGGVAIIRIDVQGAIELIPKMEDVVSIFILPPSLEELRNRIEKRETDTPEKIEERMGTAIAEIVCSYFYDNQVVNDDLNQALDCLEAILNGDTYDNTELADKCMNMTLNKRTIEKIEQFSSLADKTGIGKSMKILYKTRYANKDVGITLAESGRLRVVYLNSSEKYSFSNDYGSNGEMDVVTEFVNHLLKNPQNDVDNS